MSITLPRARLARACAAALLAWALAGCAAQPAPQPTSTMMPDSEHGPIVLAVAEDNAGAWQQLVTTWNASHPAELVTLEVLSSDSATRHQALADAGRADRGAYTVMALDSIWLPEFAANGWLAEMPSADFSTEGMLEKPASLGTYLGTRYGLPVTADAGLLYYRKDLLDAAKVKVPTTWAQVGAACDQISAQRRTSGGCYGTALVASEALTVAATEAVYSAGGEIVDDTGAAVVDTVPAKAGVSWLASAVKDGTISAEATGWDDDEAVQAFADGKLVFLRSWSGAWSRTQLTDGTSKVAGRVQVAAVVGPGSSVAVTGGYQLAIAAAARNQGTADDLVRWLTSADAQRVLAVVGSQGPVLASLYAEPELSKGRPWLTALATAQKSAKSRPVNIHYAELSLTMQDALVGLLEGKGDSNEVLSALQERLAGMLK